MELKLSPAAVAVIEEELQTELYSSPEEVVEAALELWSDTRQSPIQIIDPATGRVCSEDEVRALVQVGLDDEAAGRMTDLDLDEWHWQAGERLRQRMAT